MISNWNKLSPALFEKLCASVLKNAGFVNIQWYGAVGSDKGRDIIAEKIDSPVPGVERRETWMIQCKRYIQKSLTKAELKNLLDAALEHSIDNVLVIVTSAISANLRDWVKGVEKLYPFKTFIWEEVDFREQVLEHKSDLIDLIPELMEGRDPIWMYPRDNREVRFGSNEFGEVEIVIINTDSVDDAQRKASEFLKYIATNGFDWWH